MAFKIPSRRSTFSNGTASPLARQRISWTNTLFPNLFCNDTACAIQISALPRALHASSHAEIDSTEAWIGQRSVIDELIPHVPSVASFESCSNAVSTFYRALLDDLCTTPTWIMSWATYTNDMYTMEKLTVMIWFSRFAGCMFSK